VRLLLLIFFDPIKKPKPLALGFFGVIPLFGFKSENFIEQVSKNLKETQSYQAF